MRAVLAVVASVVAWVVWSRVASAAPDALRFAVAWVFLIVGPGLAAAVWLGPHADAMERWALPWSAGLIASPLLADMLGRLGVISTFPIVAALLGGTGLAVAMGRARATAVPNRAWIACGLAVAIAATAGGVAYAHRLQTSPEGVTIFGQYDAFDSSYYAAMSAELANRIPPQSAFRAGHRLNYSYYPELMLAMVYRFGGVPLLKLYFAFAWPTFLVTLALSLFIAVRRMATSGVALLATVLVVLGSDMSYLAAMLVGDQPDWDHVLWSTNWMTPGAELLYFNPWTPALAILFLCFWSLTRHEESPAGTLLAMAVISVASLMQFKPFAFAVLVGGLLIAAIRSRGDPVSRWRFLAAGAGGAVLALPFITTALWLYADSESGFQMGNGYQRVLPRVVITQLSLGESIGRLVAALGGGATISAVAPVACATLLFLTGGLGMRAAGLSGVWRALRHGGGERPIWRLVAWMIVVGALPALVVVTNPYHQTFMFWQAGLFLLWLFVAREVLGAGRRTWQSVAVAGAVVLLAVPSTLHYLSVKWTDTQNGFARVDEDEAVLVKALRQLDRNRTVVLHHVPDRPSLLSILSERRVVLAWARYERGSLPTKLEIDDFFNPVRPDPARAWALLTANRVTHVVEVTGDRINRDVLSKFRLVLSTPTYRLYEVPRT